MVRIHHRGVERTVSDASWQATVDALVRELGPWEPGVSRVDSLPDAPVTPPVLLLPAPASSSTRASTVSMRHLAQTRAHAAARPLADVAAELDQTVTAERRRDLTITPRELARGLRMNGGLRFEGLQLREQAVRGLLTRLESPAWTFVHGLRDRIAGDASEAEKAHDKQTLVATLERECERFPTIPLKLRVRDGLEDVYAIVSPSYEAADWPTVRPELLAALPADAKGSYAYDPVTTTWEVRGQVWTPTPADQHAVGEAFEGFVSFYGRDNGTGHLGGGGGILILVCLNGAVAQADGSSMQRRHVGRIRLDLAALARKAGRAITTLCTAWGEARGDVIERPQTDHGTLIPIEEAILGFYRYLLTSRASQLVGVLPGRTVENVRRLSDAYFGERRDGARIVRADLAQGWTRASQAFPMPVQREAERAIGRWITHPSPVSYLPAA